MRFLVSSTLILLVLTAPVRADDSQGANHWLMKLGSASTDLSYDGTFVYVHGHSVEVMRVVRLIHDNSVRERIYSLNGAAREIVRDSKEVWCYLPEKKMGMHQYRQVTKKSFPNILPQRLGELRVNYHIELGRKDRIADRLTQQIHIKPNDDYRYGFDLWVDVETGLLLKAALLDTDSAPIEQYMFTDIQIGEPITQSALEPVTAKTNLKWFGAKNPDSSMTVAKSEWRAAQVPSGFMLSNSRKRLSPMRNRMLEHHVYTDGLATVSVFIEENPNRVVSPVSGVNRMGAVHAFGTTIDDHQVTVVGEVPAKTVDLIGMSVMRVK